MDRSVRFIVSGKCTLDPFLAGVATRSVIYPIECLVAQLT